MKTAPQALGRFVIAPDSGGTAEYLRGRDNIVYDQFSAQDLSSAMERTAIVDRKRVGKMNARIVAKWGEAIVRYRLDALACEDGDHRNQFVS
jgi:hypothetical protein